MGTFITSTGNVPLTEAENKIINTLGYDYQERAVIVRALITYANADKVLRVLELNGGLKKPQASYTLYPIITQIGERTPEQYIQDVKVAVDAFNRDYWAYIRKMRY